MNAHNEQQGFTAGDIADQGARQFEAGYAAAKAEQPPAAQEAVRQPDGYHYRYPDIYGGTYIRKNNGGEVNGRKPVEAVPYWYTPVTAAPACPACEGHPSGANIPCAVCKSTPAAPGIDLQWLVEELDEIGSLSRNLRHGGCDAGDLAGLESGLESAIDTAHRLRDRLLDLIDASPKGDHFGDATKMVQDSPKGGDEARDAARYRWPREQRRGYPGLTIAKVNEFGLEAWAGDDPDAAIDSAMQAGDAEVQP